jgi:hypothetical protein
MKNTIFALTLLSTTLCYAGASLSWEIDLSSYSVGSNLGLFRLQNESVVVSDNKGDSYQLLVFNSLGTNELVDTVSASSLILCMISSDPDHFGVAMSGAPSNILKLYELENGSYLNTSSISFSGGSISYSTEDSINSGIFYTIEGSTLKQYKTDAVQSKLDGVVASGINGDNYTIHWDSVSGISYQIQSSINLTNWIDVGIPIVGNGELLSWANALTNSQSFYRVIEK